MDRQVSNRGQLSRWDGGLDELENIGMCMAEGAFEKQWYEYGSDGVDVWKWTYSIDRG